MEKEIKYADIIEVKTTRGERYANDLLKEGWILLAINQWSDSSDGLQDACSEFVLGLPKTK